VPSAAGGWVVPSFANGGILSVLHTNEMVLPASLSSFVQQSAAAYSGGGAGGGPVIHNWNIAAVDAAGVAKFLRQNGPALVAALNSATRNGAMLRGA
jgi:hypothetical protein